MFLVKMTEQITGKTVTKQLQPLTLDYLSEFKTFVLYFVNKAISRKFNFELTFLTEGHQGK